MQNRTIKFTPKNIAFYLGGFFVVSLGVVFMLRGNLGAGAWDTVTYNLRAFLQSRGSGITLGLTSMTITLTLFVIVMAYQRKWQLVFMLIPIGIMGSFIDFWDIIVFGSYIPTTFLIQLLFSVIGGVFIPLGLALIISSHFPAFVFDELTIAVMKLFRTKNLTVVRLGIEFTGISLGILFGFLAGIGFGAVNVGSIIMAIILPPMLHFFVKKLGSFDE
jgi:uncharacterized membrane protein YczE